MSDGQSFTGGSDRLHKVTINGQEAIITHMSSYTSGNTTSWTLTLPNMVQSKRKHKGINMKEKIAVLLSLVLIAGGIVYGVHRYDQVHHVQLVEQAEARSAAWLASQKKAAENQAATVQLNALKAQCAKDHATYVAETPAQRAVKGSVTDCNPSLVVAQ